MGPLLAAILATGGGMLAEKGLDKVTDKVMGVPTPSIEDNSGYSGGTNYRDFLDGAFPGTTPVERLGANTPAGSNYTADSQAKSQQKMQEKELSTRSMISDRSNLAQVIAASANLGPEGLASAVGAYRGYGLLKPEDYDNANRINRDYYNLEEPLKQAETGLTEEKKNTQEHLTESERISANYAGKREFANLVRTYTGAVGDIAGAYYPYRIIKDIPGILRGFQSLKGVKPHTGSPPVYTAQDVVPKGIPAPKKKYILKTGPRRRER